MAEWGTPLAYVAPAERRDIRLRAVQHEAEARAARRRLIALAAQRRQGQQRAASFGEAPERARERQAILAEVRRPGGTTPPGYVALGGVRCTHVTVKGVLITARGAQVWLPRKAIHPASQVRDTPGVTGWLIVRDWVAKVKRLRGINRTEEEDPWSTY